MCGIVGKIYFKEANVSSTDIKRMTSAVSHRGPDDEGIYLSPDGKVGLGQRRLAIIDLSPLGHQPMSYRNRYWITFNGEIYNFQAERAVLQKEGYQFKSKTDTEVIMALYDKYKEKCLDHLRGFFAFAIYDNYEKTVFCARDRIGKKPFKYFSGRKVFIFASELKAILTQKEYRKEPDYTAIHHYLTLQYVPAPLTGFKGIKKLEAGHYLLIDLKSGKISKKRYWRLNYAEKWTLSEAEWQKKILSKLEESVKIRLMADVPLGAFLSGGIDSSAVVGLMSRLSKKPVKTFSIGFSEQKYNELPYARIIAKKFKTEHHEIIVKPDAMEVLPFLVRHYEEPYADSSALPTYYVSRATRDYVTVALNGDGGDENFAGYSRYSAFKFSLLYEKFKLLNSVALPLTATFAKTFRTTFFERANRFSKTINDDYRRRYLTYMAYFNNEQKKALYTREFTRLVWQNDTYDLIAEKFLEAATPDKMDQTLYADFSTYLPEDLMAKVDIASMSVALEGRSPFLDHEFLELTAKIPFDLKLFGADNKKYILKKALEGFIPDEILYRKKMGFGLPIDDWFRLNLKDYTREILLSRKALERKLFRQKEIKNILDEHESSKINFAYRIWALLTLELWFREFFDK